MKPFFIILIIVLSIASVVGYFFGRLFSTAYNATRILPTVSPTPIVFGKPVNVRIPKLHVLATVESVGLDSQKNMDVPKKVENVAWYQYGPKPGERGNAVLAGHLDTITGAPAVFYDLYQLEKGDEVIITDENGKESTFSVVSIDTYPVDTFPIDTVFGKDDKRYVNLITCQGEFNRNRKLYADRLVVRTELKSYEY